MVDTLVARIVAAQDPVTPPEWRQPTGAHDAYLPGEIVACDGKRWRNDLTDPTLIRPPAPRLRRRVEQGDLSRFMV